MYSKEIFHFPECTSVFYNVKNWHISEAIARDLGFSYPNKLSKNTFSDGTQLRHSLKLCKGFLLVTLVNNCTLSHKYKNGKDIVTLRLKEKKLKIFFQN